MSYLEIAKKTITLIPARGGSKGILKKNIKKLLEKPLICWTIEAAKASSCVDRIVVSTEDKDIAKVAVESGAEVPFLRPNELATDNAKSVDMALHALNNLPSYDWLLLLQPTSPLRTCDDIDNVFKFCFDKKASSVVSVCEVEQHPNKMYTLNDSYKLSSLLSNHSEQERRQDLPRVFTTNGAIYLVNIAWFKKRKKYIDHDTIGYEMPLERSIDIDTLNDWYIAENILKDKIR